MAASDIEVVFPNPCATLPRDRAGNGWSSLPANDDDSTANLPIPFKFSLFGTPFTSLWVNNNGNLSFDVPVDEFRTVPFPSSNYVMVAGWWTDIDTEGGASGTVWYKTIGSNTFAAAWDRVGVFEDIDSGPNTFQIIISDGTNPDMGFGNNICFCYQDLGSIRPADDAAEYTGTVGANLGNGIDFFQVGRFDHSGTDYDGPSGINDGWDYLDNKSLCYQE